MIRDVFHARLLNKASELPNQWLPNRILLDLFDTNELFGIASPVELGGRLERQGTAKVSDEGRCCLRRDVG